jgi:hypothetical protein
MDNVVIRLIVEGNTKKAVDELENLTEEEKRVKKEFDNAKKAADNFGKEAAEAGKKANKGAKDAKNGIVDLNKQLDNLKSYIIGAFSIGAITSFTKSIIQTRGEFERYEAVLKNTLGSSNAAELAMQQIQEIAAKTPFSVSELTASYVKLVNQGFKPTSQEIIKLGDVAASQGKSFDQLTEAIIDAQTGEFERLKEFGIRASKEGNKVTFSFKEQKTQVDFTNESIRDYILSLGDLEGVSGGMAAISETLNGKISNLGDSWDRLLNNLGKANSGVIKGAFDALGNAINNLAEEQEVLNELDRLFAISSASMVDLYGGLILGLKDYRTNVNSTAKSVNDYNKAILNLTERKNNLTGPIAKVKRETIIYNDVINKIAQDKKDYLITLDKEKKKEEEAAKAKAAAAEAAKKKTSAYDELNANISKYTKYLLDELTLKHKINSADVKRLNQLEEEKQAIDEQLIKLKFLQSLKDKPLTHIDDGSAVVTEEEKAQLIDKQVESTKKLAKAVEENNEDDLKALDEILKKEAERKQIIIELINLTSTLANAYFEQQLQQIAIERDARLKMIEDEKNARIEQAGITNQKRLEYERQFELERQQVLKEAFEQEKKWKKQQAIINGALAITNILATTPDPTGIITGIRIGAAIATTAAQVAAIDAQKFEKGGWIGGKRHRDGGTLIEAEADEFVVNRKDAQANKGLLESLNKGMSEKYIYDKYVLPAILNKSLNQVNQQGLADNIANSLKYQMYDDHYLRKTFKQASMQSAEYIVSNLKYTQKPSRYV